MSFAPTTTAMKYGASVENYGSAYIDLNSAKQAGMSDFDIKTLSEAGMISKQSIEIKPASGTGSEYGKDGNAAKTVTYLVIPSTYNITAESTSPGYEASRVDQKNPNFIANPAHYGLTK